MAGKYYRRGHMVTGRNGRRFYRSGHWVKPSAAVGGGLALLLSVAAVLFLISGDPGSDEPQEKPPVHTPAVPAPAVQTVTPGTTLAPDPGVTNLPDIVIE